MLTVDSNSATYGTHRVENLILSPMNSLNFNASSKRNTINYAISKERFISLNTSSLIIHI